MRPDATVVLVRHAATEDPDRCHGAVSDPPLSSLGRRQAQGAALRLRVLGRELGGFTRLLTSPAERAIQTTAELAVPLGLTPAVDERWRERSFGSWEGRRWAELWDEVEPAVLDTHETYVAWTPPDGEPADAVAARVTAALEDALSGTGTTLVITHAGPVRHALATALDVGVERVLGVEVAHARATVLTRTGPSLQVTRLGA